MGLWPSSIPWRTGHTGTPGRTSSSRTNGRWGPITRIGPIEGATERVRLAVDSAGTVVATWLDFTFLRSPTVTSCGPDAKLLGQDWQEPRTLSGRVSADVSVVRHSSLMTRTAPSWFGSESSLMRLPATPPRAYS